MFIFLDPQDKVLRHGWQYQASCAYAQRGRSSRQSKGMTMVNINTGTLTILDPSTENSLTRPSNAFRASQTGQIMIKIYF